MEEDTPKFSFHKKGSIHQAYAGTTSCPISPLGICIFFPRILIWVFLYILFSYLTCLIFPLGSSKYGIQKKLMFSCSYILIQFTLTFCGWFLLIFLFIMCCIFLLLCVLNNLLNC